MDARELASAKGAGTVAAFSPDGARVVTAGPTTLPAVRGAADLRAQAVLPGLAGGFSSVAFSPDGATVAIGATGSNSLLWNTANPAAATTRLETKLFTVTAIAYLNDGRRLVTSNPYRSIQFWDPSTGEECGEFDVDVAMESAIAVSSDQTTLGVVTRDQRMCIFRGR
jgi:WD40 repeat protein